MGKALEVRLDLFEAVAAQLAGRRAQGGDSLSVGLGLDAFSMATLTYSTKFGPPAGSCNNPTLIKDYFQKLGKVLKKYAFKPENMCNMDKKGLLLDFSNRATVIVRQRRRMPMETQDGPRKWVTVVECASAGQLSYRQ